MKKARGEGDEEEAVRILPVQQILSCYELNVPLHAVFAFTRP